MAQAVSSQPRLVPAPSFLPETPHGEPPALTADDEERFRRIAIQNLDFVWRCLRRMGIPPSDVDDAVQQVFLVVASKLSAIAVESERAFLFGTASRIAANMGRHVRRRQHAITGFAQTEWRDAPSPEDMSDMLRARVVLDRILAEMPTTLREVFVLFELEELGIAEVADVLSIPIGTVGSRLRRAREDFRSRTRRLNALWR